MKPVTSNRNSLSPPVHLIQTAPNYKLLGISSFKLYKIDIIQTTPTFKSNKQSQRKFVNELGLALLIPQSTLAAQYK